MSVRKLISSSAQRAPHQVSFGVKWLKRSLQHQHSLRSCLTSASACAEAQRSGRYIHSPPTITFMPSGACRTASCTTNPSIPHSCPTSRALLAPIHFSFKAISTLSIPFCTGLSLELQLLKGDLVLEFFLQ